LPSISHAEWLHWPQTRAVFAALSPEGVATRAVGGAVRDALIGRAAREVDLATTAPPKQVMALAARAGLKAIPTGIDHGTVTVVADGTRFEVTTLRRDVETFGRHARVAFTDDWAQDAGRRDFTINALYAGVDGEVFDPLGGMADIEARRVRFIGDPVARIREDYLRILRFFRFSADYGRPPYDAAALAACTRERAGMSRLSPERVRAEILRLLGLGGAGAALWAMFDHGLLVDVLGGVPYLTRFERLAAIESAINACARVSGCPTSSKPVFLLPRARGRLRPTLTGGRRGWRSTGSAPTATAILR
jgi:poly(A) polymerase